LSSGSVTRDISDHCFENIANMKNAPIENFDLRHTFEKNWKEMKQISGGTFRRSCSHIFFGFTTKHRGEGLTGSRMNADFAKYFAAIVVATAFCVQITSCAEEKISPNKQEIEQLETLPASNQSDTTQLQLNTDELEETPNKVVRCGRYRY
jgi:hypothetical protein